MMKRALAAGLLLATSLMSADVSSRLKELRGKVVVLNFWATWCGPCREEMPMMVQAEKQWAAKGVVFVAASLDEKSTQKAIPEFLEKYGVKYTVWQNATLNDLAKFHLGQGVPDTLFIDEEGKVFARVKGEIRREELDARLEWITGGRKGAAPEPLVDHMK